MGGSVRGRVWGKWGGWVVCVRAFLPPIISGQFGSRSKWNNKKQKTKWSTDRSVLCFKLLSLHHLFPD